MSAPKTAARKSGKATKTTARKVTCNDNADDAFFSRSDIADYLGCSIRTTNRLSSQGILPPYETRAGVKHLWKVSTIKKLEAKLKEECDSIRRNLGTREEYRPRDVFGADKIDLEISNKQGEINSIKHSLYLRQVEMERLLEIKKIAEKYASK